MNSILQLHFQMQRRSHLEQWIALASIAAVTIFFTANLCLHFFVDELLHPQEDTTFDTDSGNQKNKAPMSRWLQKQQQPPHHKPGRDGQQLRKSRVRYQPDPAVVTVRQQFERDHPIRDPEHIHRLLQEQRIPDPHPPPLRDNDTSSSNLTYDIYNCPDTPPPNYAAHWNAISVLRHWNPDTTTVPTDYIHQSLCVWDWLDSKHRAAVQAYREAEVPFVLKNHPAVARTSYRWSTVPKYVERLVGSAPQRNEHSHHSNHLMFWRKSNQRANKAWQPPTENVELNVTEWLSLADQVEQLSDEQQAASDHWYFRLNAALPDLNTYLYDELPFFQPWNSEEEDSEEDNDDSSRRLFIVDPTQQRGINCRFGMKGSIAEAHFDPTRNWIALLKGRRRFILAHPDQCPHLELYPQEHPSGRHSAVDWSRVDDTHKGPFQKARVTEVVLQAGDALYLPTSWFHFIVSLNTNFQCNARSGFTTESFGALERCGFGVPQSMGQPHKKKH